MGPLRTGPIPAINKKDGDIPSDLKRCFMISDGALTNEPKHDQSFVTRGVNMAMSQARAAPAYLKWSETTITFDRTDHSNHIL